MKDRPFTAEQHRVRRLREASEWVLRMQDGGRTEADVEEWLRWCSADPENFTTFETVQADWQDLGALRHIAAGSTSSSESEETGKSDANWTTPPPAGTPLGYRRLRLSPRIRLARAVAAIALIGIAGAAGVAMLWTQRHPEVQQNKAPIVATDMNRAQTLPDGSQVILRTESALNIDFQGAQRHIRLVSGEAYFNVRPDKSHPFVVNAGAIRVTDVGTRFDIRRGDGRIAVTVEEGVVRVTAVGAARQGLPSEWTVRSGYQFRYSAQRHAQLLSRVDVAKALQWRDGELAYVDEPLQSVVTDLNQYAAHKIRVADPAISAMRFTGTVFPTALHDWLRAVEQAYPITVRTASNGDIVLTARKGRRSFRQ